MLILETELTAGLIWWLSQAHDDGCEALQVRQAGAHVQVTRQGGGDLSDTEQNEVIALLAAHSVSPLQAGE